MKLLHLLPVGNVDDALLKDISPAIEEILGTRCKILPVRLDPEFAFHGERQQYHSSEILHGMQKFIGPIPGGCWALRPSTSTFRFLLLFSAKHRWAVRAPCFQPIGCGRSSMVFHPIMSYFAIA